MPGCYIESLADKAARRKRAEAKVRAKFPNIIEGSSGWHRALANRLRRSS